MTIQAIAPALATSTAPRSITRYTAPAARILLGLVFFVFGLDGLLHFMPQPTKPPPEGAMALGMAMMKSGYLFQLVKGTEVAVGALLLANRLVPLALVILAPVLVNIFAFHAFLAPWGVVLPAVLIALEIHLAWVHRSVYRPLFVLRPALDRKA